MSHGAKLVLETFGGTVTGNAAHRGVAEVDDLAYGEWQIGVFDGFFFCSLWGVGVIFL